MTRDVLAKSARCTFQRLKMRLERSGRCALSFTLWLNDPEQPGRLIATPLPLPIPEEAMESPLFRGAMFCALREAVQKVGAVGVTFGWPLRMAQIDAATLAKEDIMQANRDGGLDALEAKGLAQVKLALQVIAQCAEYAIIVTQTFRWVARERVEFYGEIDEIEVPIDDLSGQMRVFGSGESLHSLLERKYAELGGNVAGATKPSIAAAKEARNAEPGRVRDHGTVGGDRGDESNSKRKRLHDLDHSTAGILHQAVPPQLCPNCGASISVPRPQRDDHILCMMCAEYLVLTDDGRVRSMTLNEIIQLQETPEWPTIFRTRRAILNYRAQYPITSKHDRPN